MPRDDIPPLCTKTWTWPRPPVSTIVFLYVLLLFASATLPRHGSQASAALAALFTFFLVVSIPSSSSKAWNRARGSYWIVGIVIALLALAQAAFPPRLADLIQHAVRVVGFLVIIAALLFTCFALADDLRPGHEPSSDPDTRRYGTLSLLCFWVCVTLALFLLAIDNNFGTSVAKLAAPAIVGLRLTSLIAAILGLVYDHRRARSVWALVFSVWALCAPSVPHH